MIIIAIKMATVKLNNVFENNDSYINIEIFKKYKHYGNTKGSTYFEQA